MALELPLLEHAVQHEDGLAPVLPDRQPEVPHGQRKRTCSDLGEGFMNDSKKQGKDY